MGTSGTIATTVIDNSALIEHAFRRCKILPSAQTPETVLIARECLYMLCLNLGNRGLNLWCVDKGFMGLTAGQPTYITPNGTLDILNVIFSQPTLATRVFTATASGGNATLTATSITRVGFTFSAPFTGEIAIKSSTATLVTLGSQTYNANQAYWADLPVATTDTSFNIEGVLAPFPALSDIQLASSTYDLPCSQWNRDTYAALNNKTQAQRPSTSYFFEKKLIPTLTLWPVPINNTDHLTIYRHRQPQDVGDLSDQLEIPQRWLDGIIWLLAARLCFELPQVDPAVVQNVVSMAEAQVLEAEESESDGAPIYLSPTISVYTR